MKESINPPTTRSFPEPVDLHVVLGPSAEIDQVTIVYPKVMLVPQHLFPIVPCDPWLGLALDQDPLRFSLHRDNDVGPLRNGGHRHGTDLVLIAVILILILVDVDVVVAAIVVLGLQRLFRRHHPLEGQRDLDRHVQSLSQQQVPQRQLVHAFPAPRSDRSKDSFGPRHEVSPNAGRNGAWVG